MTNHLSRVITYCQQFILSRLTLLNLFFLFSFLAQAQFLPYESIDAHPKYETRAVWLTTIGGLDWPRQCAYDAATTRLQKAELCRILDYYQQIHINTVIFQTRVRGSVLYPSQYEPWYGYLTGTPGKAPLYDPLQFCIDECHRRGMELHAWVVCIPLGKVSEQKKYGSSGILRRRPELCKIVGKEVFMVPGNPKTADYIASICREIAERYDIDGISLDYIRYPEKEFKFSDNNLYKGSPSGLSDWKRENITRIVRRIHDEVKAVKPWVKLSSSPVGKYDNTRRYSSGGWNCYSAVFQDPRQWLRDDLQDMLFPMMYFQGTHFYPFLYDWQENRDGHPVVPGLGIYFLDPREGRWMLSQVRAEMHSARRSEIGGIAFYRSEFLIRNVQGIYDACRDEFFPHPALTSRMTWMPGYFQLPSVPTSLQCSPGRLSWQGDAYCYNVYGSNEYPVDCSRAENLVAARILSTAYEPQGRAGGRRFYAVTACNRYGAETEPLQQSFSAKGDSLRQLNVSYLINRDLKGTKKSKKSKRKRRK